MVRGEIKIIKANGEEDIFSLIKLEKSLERAGVEKEEARKIAEEVKGKIKNGTTTLEIYKMAFRMVKNLDRPTAAHFSLKQALMELGPTGYPFEQLVGRILAKKGYKVSFPESVKGKCIEHEVDVKAEKGEERIMIEAKFHNQPGFRTDAKTAMYVRGRFEDLTLAESGFNKCWLVTNTKFTEEAKKYTACVGIQAIGWNYPSGGGISEMIFESGLHPITILFSLSKAEKRMLLDKEIVVLEDIIGGLEKLKKIGISEEGAKKAIKEAEEIIVKR